jgi:hypothetical protein
MSSALEMQPLRHWADILHDEAGGLSSTDQSGGKRRGVAWVTPALPRAIRGRRGCIHYAPLALALIKGFHGNAFLVVGDGRLIVLAPAACLLTFGNC